jgi:hypothetical protein
VGGGNVRLGLPWRRGSVAADSDRGAVREQANLRNVQQAAFKFLDSVPVGIFITAPGPALLRESRTHVRGST